MQHFFSGFFQFGYVTRDVDAALAAYREKYGPIEFMVFEPAPVDGVAPPTRRIALAYIDDVMTEIIEPDPDQETIYDDALPANPGAIALHHFGYLIDDHEAMLKRLSEAGYQLPLHGKTPGALSYIYADTRSDLGHYCEFIRLEEGGRAFFDSVPRSRTR